MRCKCGRTFKGRALPCPECRKSKVRGELIERIQEFHRRKGRPPTARECGAGINPQKLRSCPSYSTLQWAFGSLNKAILTAGLTPRKLGARLDRHGPLSADAPHRHRARRIEPTLRQDFVLAFPDMKRELERQCQYPGTIHVTPSDLSFLPYAPRRRRSA
jgi:hypothetical protein